jgi:hypothetical protein
MDGARRACHGVFAMHCLGIKLQLRRVIEQLDLQPVG